MIRGLLTDEQWAFFEPFVIETGALRGRPPRDHRRTLDAVFWIALTGAPWRDLPEELGRWNSVHRQYRRWTASGLWVAMRCEKTDKSYSAIIGFTCGLMLVKSVRMA